MTHQNHPLGPTSQHYLLFSCKSHPSLHLASSAPTSEDVHTPLLICQAVLLHSHKHILYLVQIQPQLLQLPINCFISSPFVESAPCCHQLLQHHTYCFHLVRSNRHFTAIKLYFSFSNYQNFTYLVSHIR